MFLQKIFCIFTTLLLAPYFILAQSSLDTIQTLGEVEVVAARTREIIPAQRISGKKLEALSSFSVADAVRYFSGVQIKDFGGIGGMKTVDIRSMGSNHLGVFYDGIEIGNAQNGTVDLGKFSLDFIEEVSVYNGHKSEIFQSAKDFGSAGTIYLRTRRPRFKADKRTNTIAYFRTGSFGLINPSVLWEQKISENISSSLNAEYIQSTGKYKYRYTTYNTNGTIASDTTAVRQNGDIQAVRLEGGFNGYIQKGGDWNVKGYFYNSEKGLPGAIVDNVWKNAQRQWDKNIFLQSQFRRQNLLPNYDFLINAKYSHDYMRYKNPDTSLMLIDNLFWQQEIYVSAANKYSILPTWGVNLAVDYIWNKLNANLVNFAKPTRNTLLAALATAFEWNRLKAQASLLGTFITDNTMRQNTSGVNNYAKYTPALFLNYRSKILQGIQWRLFYKHTFRMPTFNDLYYTDIGEANIRPETAMQFNAGIFFEESIKDKYISLQHFRLSIDGYVNKIKDKIVAFPKGGSSGGSLYRWTVMNIGEVHTNGVEAIATTAWLLNYNIELNTSLTYTYQEARDVTDENSTWYGGQISYIPWHSGSAIINASWETWELNYSFIYVGERYHNSANIADNHEQPWYTHDLTIGKIIRFDKSKKTSVPVMKISAEVNNLLNQAYEVIDCYPMPGLNFKIILKLEI